MRRDALVSSVSDADSLQRRGRDVIRRGSRHSIYALAGMGASAAVVGLCFYVAMNSYDGTYEGTLRANWSMLGLVVAIGALNFTWALYHSRRRLRQTGERLIRRAEYQRSLAALQLTEAEHDALR